MRLFLVLRRSMEGCALVIWAVWGGCGTGKSPLPSESWARSVSKNFLFLSVTGRPRQSSERDFWKRSTNEAQVQEKGRRGGPTRASTPKSSGTKQQRRKLTPGTIKGTCWSQNPSMVLPKSLVPRWKASASSSFWGMWGGSIEILL